MSRILLATDAWSPQVNGVVRTWETSKARLEAAGHMVAVLHPGLFCQLPAPFYREIQLAIPTRSQIARFIREFDPEMVHIATEGPIGLATRTWCLQKRWRFTTSYHTKFPEFLNHLAYVPISWSYRFMRWFHSASSAVLVSTPSLEKELRAHGFDKIRRWSRGVDLTLFYPRPKTWDYPRPILLYAGRVSKEKNLDAFLSLETPGTKVIVGDGPIREALAQKYPQAIFLGYRKGNDLAEAYASADLFVFPSRSDTFGLVMIEAMACGTPVAAYPVVGPIDIVTAPGTGALHEDLSTAIKEALATGDSQSCIEQARQFTWERCTEQLLRSLVSIR